MVYSYVKNVIRAVAGYSKDIQCTWKMIKMGKPLKRWVTQDVLAHTWSGEEEVFVFFSNCQEFHSKPISASKQGIHFHAVRISAIVHKSSECMDGDRMVSCIPSMCYSKELLSYLLLMSIQSLEGFGLPDDAPFIAYDPTPCISWRPRSAVSNHLWRRFPRGRFPKTFYYTD